MPEASFVDLVANVIKLSEGDFERLEYFSRRAENYPLDIVFCLAPLRELRGRLRARDVSKLRKLWKLSGGPVELPDVSRNPRADDFDLMHGLGPASGFLCSVCRKEYASLAPEVWLSEHISANETASRRLRVHPACLTKGEAIATRQGYGWHVDPL
jgi:hypothetical protein